MSEQPIGLQILPHQRATLEQIEAAIRAMDNPTIKDLVTVCGSLLGGVGNLLCDAEGLPEAQVLGDRLPEKVRTAMRVTVEHLAAIGALSDPTALVCLVAMMLLTGVAGSMGAPQGEA